MIRAKGYERKKGGHVRGGQERKVRQRKDERVRKLQKGIG